MSFRANVLRQRVENWLLRIRLCVTKEWERYENRWNNGSNDSNDKWFVIWELIKKYLTKGMIGWSLDERIERIERIVSCLLSAIVCYRLSATIKSSESRPKFHVIVVGNQFIRGFGRKSNKYCFLRLRRSLCLSHSKVCPNIQQNTLRVAFKDRMRGNHS